MSFTDFWRVITHTQVEVIICPHLWRRPFLNAHRGYSAFKHTQARNFFNEQHERTSAYGWAKVCPVDEAKTAPETHHFCNIDEPRSATYSNHLQPHRRARNFIIGGELNLHHTLFEHLFIAVLSENFLKLIEKTNFWYFPVCSGCVSLLLIIRAGDRLRRSYKQTNIRELSRALEKNYSRKALSKTDNFIKGQI